MKRRSALLAVPALCCLLAACSGRESIVDPTVNFFLPFGTKPGQLGVNSAITQGASPFDRQLFTEHFNFDYNRISVLDKENGKLLQYEYGGKNTVDVRIADLARKGDKGEGPGGHLVHVASDSDHNIYFAEAGTEGRWAVWQHRPGRKDLSRMVERRTSDEGKESLPKSARLAKLHGLDDRLVLVWEHLPAGKDEKDESFSANRYDIVDTEKGKTVSYAVPLESFTAAAEDKYRYKRVIALFPLPGSDSLVAEVLYARDAAREPFRRLLFRFDFGSREAKRLPVNLDDWSGCFGVSSGNEIFILENVVARKKMTRALFAIQSAWTGNTRYLAIGADPTKYYLGNFYFANGGQLFSFNITFQGLQIVSWK